MATPQSQRPERIDDKHTASIELSGNVNLLMVGKAGIGKTCLTNAILKGKSSGGKAGPKTGTESLIVPYTYEIRGIRVNVYDVRGLSDGIVSSNNIIQAVQKNCIMEQLSAVVVCFRFDQRLDTADQAVFHHVNKLKPGIWKKVVFAITHCDQIPSEIEELDSDVEKCAAIKKLWMEWDECIKHELKKINLPDEIIDNIQIAPTTRTNKYINAKYFSFIEVDQACEAVKVEEDVNPGCFPWLQYLWSKFLSNVCTYKENDQKFMLFFVARLAYLEQNWDGEKLPNPESNNSLELPSQKHRDAHVDVDLQSKQSDDAVELPSEQSDDAVELPSEQSDDAVELPSEQSDERHIPVCWEELPYDTPGNGTSQNTSESNIIYDVAAATSGVTAITGSIVSVAAILGFITIPGGIPVAAVLGVASICVLIKVAKYIHRRIYKQE